MFLKNAQQWSFPKPNPVVFVSKPTCPFHVWMRHEGRETLHITQRNAVITVHSQ